VVSIRPDQTDRLESATALGKRLIMRHGSPLLLPAAPPPYRTGLGRDRRRPRGGGLSRRSAREQLAGGPFGGDQVLRPQGDGADAGALKSESVVEVVGECCQRARVGSVFGQLASTSCRRAVCVADSESEGAGRLGLAAQPYAEAVGEREQGGALSVPVQLVLSEVVFDAHRAGRG
jgi:hypothetical protein